MVPTSAKHMHLLEIKKWNFKSAHCVL